MEANLSADARTSAHTRPAKLRRELGFWGTASLAAGGMAPTLAMSTTGVQSARLIGQAAPLAYVLAGIGIALVGYGFARLSAAFSHAGSVYAFIGRTLGPRAGFFAGWALIGTYIVFPPVSIAGVAIFGQAFLKTTGLASDPAWFPIAVAAWALIWVLAARGIRLTTTSLWVVEAVSLLLITALVVVIFVKLAVGDPPTHQALNLDFLTIPEGTTFSALGLAATFGFLSFGGFESAMSLGEESQKPLRMIPRSIWTAVAFGGIFYVICITAQTLGFGTDSAGVTSFSHSAAPLGDLAMSYVGPAMAALLDVGALLSALGAGLAGVAVASRTLFAFGRDGVFGRFLAGVSPRTGTPTSALAASMTLSAVALVIFALAGTSSINVFFYLATIGVLCLLVLYMLTSFAAMRLLQGRATGVARLELIVPAAGVFVAGYVLYRNLVPVPDFPFNLFPYIVAAWLLAGLTVTIAVPGLSKRIAERLGEPGADNAGG